MYIIKPFLYVLFTRKVFVLEKIARTYRTATVRWGKNPHRGPWGRNLHLIKGCKYVKLRVICANYENHLKSKDGIIDLEKISCFSAFCQ